MFVARDPSPLIRVGEKYSGMIPYRWRSFPLIPVAEKSSGVILCGWRFSHTATGLLYGRRPPDHFLGLLSRACLLGSIGMAGTEVCNCRDRRWISEQSRTSGEVQQRRNGRGAVPGTEGDRRINLLAEREGLVGIYMGAARRTTF